ncbi:MAG: hypothetical protein E2P02_17965 [Acidobacteria bacterium]|nr:MAG: hypothetical protein E2P02_17965 [Acidobacteriota bacterium]
MAKHNPYQTNTGIHIEWFTVKRSTIYALAFSAIGLFGAGIYGYFEVFGDPEPDVEQVSETDHTARFLDLDGTVKVRHSGTYEWVNATLAMGLNREDTIRTLGGSTAQVRLFDGTEYLLKPDSILVIEEAYEDPETKATNVAVKLESGQISLNTPRRNVPGSRSDVVTPGAEASFDENTTADVSFDTSTRMTGFTILRGGSAVRSGNNQVRLSASQAVEVDANSRFTDIIELPGVPLLIQPANLEILAVSKTTEFKWNPVEGVRKYNVVLGRSPNFLDPILESNISGESIFHARLEPGTYFWQVTAIDGDGRRGAPSSLAKFTVRKVVNRTASLALTVFKPSVSLDGLVTVQGRTDVNSVVTVDYGMGDDRVQVKSDGTFIYRFLVTSAGRHRVVVKARARDGGGVAEKTVYADTGTD